MFWRKKIEWTAIGDRLPKADRACCVCKVQIGGYILGVATWDGVRWITNDGQANVTWTHWTPVLSPLPTTSGL